MLISVFELLQDQDFIDLYTRFPSVKRWFNAPLRQSVIDQVDWLAKSEGGIGREALLELSNNTFGKALQHALVCAKNRSGPEFARLARRVFGLGPCPINMLTGETQSNLFVQGALYDVFSWHPDPWAHPDHGELARLEALLCLPGDTDTQLPITDEGIHYFPDLTTHIDAANERWFFSATSVAISLLQRMPRERRRNLRTIVLHEDFKAVSRPDCHAQGLIPFCLENPKLRIERRISLVANILPEKFRCFEPRSYSSSWVLISQGFRVIIPWIEEALHLASCGVPSHSFTLVIDGSTIETSETWRLLEYAAATMDARLEQYRRSGTEPPPRPLVPLYEDFWSLPKNIPKVIRDVMEGTSVVRYEGHVGEVWDRDTFLSERQDWTDKQWYMDWSRNVMSQAIPTRFNRDGPLRYQIKPDAIRTTRRIVRQGESISNDTPPRV